jgi:hypothetical protein
MNKHEYVRCDTALFLFMILRSPFITKSLTIYLLCAMCVSRARFVIRPGVAEKVSVVTSGIIQ